MKIEFTNEQLNNLIVFLNRAKLEGSEAFAWVELSSKIQQAIHEVNQSINPVVNQPIVQQEESSFTNAK
jgi:hypothetical protein